MNRVFSIAILVGLVFSVGCNRKTFVSSPRLVDSIDSLAAAKFVINEIDFNYFHFKSKVAYVDARDAQNFTVNGRVQKDSVIWLSITPGLGIEAARCLIKRDSIFLLDRLHNKLYSYDFSYINSTFNTSLTFDNLQALLMGNLSFPKKAKDRVVKQDSNYLFGQNRENLDIENFVTTNTLKIEKVEVKNLDNNSFLSLKYSAFMPLDSFLFANHIDALIKFTDKDGNNRSTIIDISHSKAEIVSKPLNFPFNVPKRFEDN